MTLFQTIRKQKGQSLSEMLICLPVLFLFAAGIFQFAVLFLSYVQFEHACGEAARQYAAGLFDKNSLGFQIQDNLGNFKRYFELGSLTISIQEPQSSVASALDHVKNILGIIPFASNYDGCEWLIQIKCRPPFLFSRIFHKGISFQTVMQVFRYPR